MRAADVIARPKPGRTYIAARFGLTLVRTPVRDIRNPSDGTIMDRTEPDRLHFRNGTFTATRKEDVEFLERHPLFGDISDGFRRLDAPAPPPSDEELAAILAAAQDPDQLEEVLQVEREGYGRPQLIELVEGQLARLEALTKPPAKG